MVLLQAVDTANAWGVFFNAAGALATSGILSAVKKTDFSIAKSPVFRKLQPAITLIGALAAPWIAAHLSSGVDVSGLGQAPMATLGTIVAAELLAMLKRSI